jgi:hypothetical protein
MGPILIFEIANGKNGSADIFQTETMDLMEALEYEQAYVEDSLVITRGTLEAT